MRELKGFLPVTSDDEDATEMNWCVDCQRGLTRFAAVGIVAGSSEPRHR